MCNSCTDGSCARLPLQLNCNRIGTDSSPRLIFMIVRKGSQSVPDSEGEIQNVEHINSVRYTFQAFSSIPVGFGPRLWWVTPGDRYAE